MQSKYTLYDTNADDKIDLEEFKKCWMEIEPRTPRREEDSFKLWMELFWLYDMDQDLNIDLVEAQRLFGYDNSRPSDEPEITVDMTDEEFKAAA